TAGRLISTVLRRVGAIPLPAPVGGDLPADRAPMPAQPPSDTSVGLAGFDPNPDLLPLLDRQRPRACSALSQHHHTVFTDPPSEGGYPDTRRHRGVLDAGPPRHRRHRRVNNRIR